MSTRYWQSKEILNPRGAWTAGALVRKNNPSRASVAQNVRFSPGVVTSREGTSAVFTTAGKVTSMYNWLSPSDNHLIYLDGSTAKRRKISDGTTDTLASGLTTTRALSCADLGPRFYFCGFDTSGYGTTQVRIYDGTYTSGVPTVDTAFSAPLTVTSMTATDGGAGQCSLGTHKIGFVFQSRSGFSGQPGPWVAGVFTPASVTLTSDQRTITLTIHLDTPADAGPGSAIYPVMTRADNPDTWFFVPGVTASLPPSASSWTQVLQISISDADLADRATSADDYFNRLTQGADGSGPFTPQFVCAYGKRMTYGVGNKVYVSNIDDPQALTEDFNVIQVPGQRNLTAACQFSADYLVFGDRWTARFSDNGDYPATWATPTEISSTIGTPAPLGIEWRTGGQWIWVASESGLFLFTGQYPSHPISFYQSDIWKRINWSAAYAIQIADDVTNLKVHVAVPLDGATEPNYDLVYDYTNGMTYDTCDFSMDNFAASTFSAIRAVKEFTTNRATVWIAPSAAGSVVRLDSATVNDVSMADGTTAAAVNAQWQSGYIRSAGEMASKTIRVGAADLWVRGAGTLIHTWYGLDRSQSVSPAVTKAGTVTAALASAPGEVLFAKADLAQVENFTMLVGTNAIDAWFSLSGIKPYFKPGLWVR